MLFGLAYLYFCIYIYKVYKANMVCFYDVLVWFWYQTKTGLTSWVKKYFFPLHFVTFIYLFTYLEHMWWSEDRKFFLSIIWDPGIESKMLS